MAVYKILYWHEFPAQINVKDGSDRVQVELPGRFQERIDQVAMERGVIGTDAYLDGWQWGEPQERAGSAKVVAEAIQRELEADFPE